MSKMSKSDGSAVYLKDLMRQNCVECGESLRDDDMNYIAFATNESPCWKCRVKSYSMPGWD
jgi:hypothetical protein